MRTCVLAVQHIYRTHHSIVGIFATPTCSFYPRISPTSFWPLFARAANESQAKRMMAEWLHSPTRFCVSKTGDMAGNNDMCYWGLPSISADDGAGVMTNHLGYWRGFVWGPLSILTYWSLQECVSFPSDSGSDSDSDFGPLQLLMRASSGSGSGSGSDFGPLQLLMRASYQQNICHHWIRLAATCLFL